MAVNLQITLGTVNYTDFLHVTVAKVSAPNTIVWENWIDVPVANYNFVIPGLDPDDYYVSFYDAPDNVSLGAFIGKSFVNAKTNEFQYEIRFYEIGNLPDGVTINAENNILNDPYLIGKNVESTFKEGFRFLRPVIEYVANTDTGDITINGNFDDEEVFCVTVKYAVGVNPASAGGLYTGTLTITEATKTLIAADKNKRIRCVGNAATQVITLTTLASINVDDGFYFDNSCGGTAVQVKLLVQGLDRILFNGFMTDSNEFAEFWVSKGEHLLMRKFIDEDDNEYWEIITDYKGVHVGEKVTVGYKNMPGILLEDGALRDGDEYGRPWWWINDVLPDNHIIIDDTVINPGYVHPVGKEGLFVKHSVLKKFRMPNTQNLSERGLKNFNTYGGDASRVYDYPGGYQAAQVGQISIPLKKGDGYNGGFQTPNRFAPGQDGNPQATDNIIVNSGKENLTKNIGVVYARRI